MTATQADIQRLIECCICCDYLTDIRETPCCHQLFCLECIRSWLQTSTQTCPRCRSTNLTEQTLLQNVVIQRFVDNLQFDCPFKLQGCPAKVPRCDLAIHKQRCSYSPEILANKHRVKLAELNNELKKYKSNSRRTTDSNWLDLAKAFFEIHEYQHARECLATIKQKKSLQFTMLQAQIERDSNHYDKALANYAEALIYANANEQKIEIRMAQGYLLIKKAQYTQAREQFQVAFDLLSTNEQLQTRAEIFNAFGLIAKKCSEVKRNTAKI
mgnify:CR=1 FL=1